MENEGTTHVIEITDIGNDQDYWECSCGTSGSCSSYRTDIASEKHVPEGDQITYRYSAAS